MSECIELDGGGYLCRSTGTRELVRRRDGRKRWCFKCRAVRRFEYVVRADIEPSWYDPCPSIECAVCETSDGDLFPGRTREWEEQ